MARVEQKVMSAQLTAPWSLAEDALQYSWLWIFSAATAPQRLQLDQLSGVLGGQPGRESREAHHTVRQAALTRSKGQPSYSEHCYALVPPARQGRDTSMTGASYSCHVHLHLQSLHIRGARIVYSRVSVQNCGRLGLFLPSKASPFGLKRGTDLSEPGLAAWLVMLIIS